MKRLTSPPRPRAALARPARHLARRLPQAALAVLVAAGLPWPCAAQATTPNEMLAHYAAQAGARPDPQRGRQFFTSPHGRDWQCASCHGVRPGEPGQHASTGRAIRPLAPAFNPQRFTDLGKTEKWFRRNCGDVVGRACTAAEKADVLAWLLTVQP